MAIEFENEVQEKVHGNIQKWLRELYGETLDSFDNENFGVGIGSAYILVFVRPWGSDDCVIDIVSRVITDIDLTPDLMKFLLLTNKEIPFGVFCILPDPETRDIWLSENLVGSTCTKEELRISMNVVGRVADDYDDEIRNKWGGQRSVDG